MSKGSSTVRSMPRTGTVPWRELSGKPVDFNGVIARCRIFLKNKKLKEKIASLV